MHNINDQREDPFACFSSDGSEIDSEDGSDDRSTERRRARKDDERGDESNEEGIEHRNRRQGRDEGCGVMTFHPNSEAALLMHVRNAVDASDNSAPEQEGGDDNPDAATIVLRSVDDFCRTRQWMMHVGPQKGRHVLSALDRAIDHFHRGSGVEFSSSSFVAVEIGTYCGYSAVMLGGHLRRKLGSKYVADGGGVGAAVGVDVRLYSFEIDPKNAEVARELIRLAGLDDLVEVIVLGGEDGAVAASASAADHVLARLERRRGDEEKIHRCPPLPPLLPARQGHQVHFLFLDHDKDGYLPDLRRFERADLIREGSVVAADNVLWCPDYLNYVRRRGRASSSAAAARLVTEEDDSTGGYGRNVASTTGAAEALPVVETETIAAAVEYSEEEVGRFGVENYRDGVEVTTYLSSPEAS